MTEQTTYSVEVERYGRYIPLWALRGYSHPAEGIGGVYSTHFVYGSRERAERKARKWIGRQEARDNAEQFTVTSEEHK